MRIVVDTNVLIAANGRDTHASTACTAACARALLEVQRDHVLLDDIHDLAYAEYSTYCSGSGQPGAGDRFFAWYMQTRWTKERVERIEILDESGDVDIDQSLKEMDPSDHKWLGIYVNGSGDIIENALDSDWAEHSATFARFDIQVTELCP